MNTARDTDQKTTSSRIYTGAITQVVTTSGSPQKRSRRAWQSASPIHALPARTSYNVRRAPRTSTARTAGWPLQASPPECRGAMTGHVAEIVGHNPETAGHVHPTYADIVRHGPKYSAKPRTTPWFYGFSFFRGRSWSFDSPWYTGAVSMLSETLSPFSDRRYHPAAYRSPS